MKKAKTSNNLLHRFLEERTTEQKEERRQQRIAKIKATSMEYQLGTYVGELIARDQLPTLSTDWIQSQNVIEVTPEESKKVEELEMNWQKSHEASTPTNTEWEELITYRQTLEEKYLPEVLECYIQPVNVEDEEQFKKGVADGIWDSDLSHYECSGPEDVTFRLDDQAMFTVVTLKRGK